MSWTDKGAHDFTLHINITLDGLVRKAEFARFSETALQGVEGHLQQAIDANMIVSFERLGMVQNIDTPRSDFVIAYIVKGARTGCERLKSRLSHGICSGIEAMADFCPDAVIRVNAFFPENGQQRQAPG